MVKNILIKGLVGFLILFTAGVTTFIIVGSASAESARGPGALVGYVLLFLTTSLYLRKLGHRLGVTAILVISLATICAVSLQVSPSLRYLLKISPSIISLILGVGSAYFLNQYDDRRRHILPAACFLFPLLLNFNVYALWVHKVEFGSFSGQVSEQQKIAFELPDKDNVVINNKTLEGKVVLFDFWYIGCGPCYVKFPELQRIYEKYQFNDQVAVYAVNRFMERDKPGRVFEELEKKGYSFPVLAGDQEIMDAFGVYVYPTVALLDQSGNVVFMGKLDGVEERIEMLLKNGTP